MRSVRPVRDDEFVDVVLGAAAPVVVGCAGTWAEPSPLGDLLDRIAAGHAGTPSTMTVIRLPRRNPAQRPRQSP